MIFMEVGNCVRRDARGFGRANMDQRFVFQKKEIYIYINKRIENFWHQGFLQANVPLEGVSIMWLCDPN